MYWTKVLFLTAAVSLIAPFVSTNRISALLSQSFAFQLLGLRETKPAENNNVRRHGNRRPSPPAAEITSFDNRNIHSQRNVEALVRDQSFNSNGQSMGSFMDMLPPGEAGIHPSNNGNGQSMDMLPPGEAGFHPSNNGNGQSMGNLMDLLPPGEAGFHPSNTGNGQSMGSFMDMLPPGEVGSHPSNNGNGQSIGSFTDVWPPAGEVGLHPSNNGNGQSLGSSNVNSQNQTITNRLRNIIRTDMGALRSRGRPALPASATGNIADVSSSLSTTDVSSGQGSSFQFGLALNTSQFNTLKQGIGRINQFQGQGKSGLSEMLPPTGGIGDMSGMQPLLPPSQPAGQMSLLDQGKQLGPSPMLPPEPAGQMPVLHKGMKLGSSPLLPKGGSVSKVDGTDFSVIDQHGVETTFDGTDITHDFIAG